MGDEAEVENLSVFRDCLSTTLIQRLAPTSSKGSKKRVRGRKNEIKPVNAGTDPESDASELADFVEYMAEEIFASLPPELRTLSYAKVQDNANLADKHSLPLDSSVLEDVVESLPASTSDSLVSYGLIEEPADLERFFDPVITSYVSTTTAAPSEYTPAVTASRPLGCEICEREHVPLTYHHLIPRQIHAKAVKRGWHKEWELNKVAWLCRACHSYVHSVASNEELAREYYDVDLLLMREDVQRYAAWVAKIRWKAK